MRPEVCAVLRDLVARHGIELLDDPRKLRAILLDHCGAARLEINLLSRAVEENLHAELQRENRPIAAYTLVRLGQRLEDHHGLAPAQALWAVQSLAVAVGVISAEQMEETQVPPSVTIETDRPAQGATGASSEGVLPATYRLCPSRGYGSTAQLVVTPLPKDPAEPYWYKAQAEQIRD